MKRAGQNILLISFILSLMFHFGSAVYVFLKAGKKQESVEINIVEIDPAKMKAFEEKARQIVEQNEKAINDEIDDKAKFLSRHNQRVVEQTRAADTGKFQNDAREGLAPKNENAAPKEKSKMADNEKTKSKEKSKTLTSPDGEVPLPKLAALKPQFKWDEVKTGVNNPGPRSQTDDHIKDLQTGPQTLLSSREFVYYSYYSRIKERLRLFWEPKIKEKVQRLFMTGRHIAAAEERITKLVITLDAKGTLVRVQVLSESGMKDLDDAAIEAFQSAAPFPNPPTGIVESDGTIKIRWDFILEADNKVLQQERPRYARNRPPL